MGKPSGFLEHERRSLPLADVHQRLQSYAPIQGPIDPAHVQDQAARCMDCGVPFCQSDDGCPLGNRIPEWNDLAFRGDYKAAIERLHATNNFPEFTGRICPAPCEGACVLAKSGDAVAIEDMERAIADFAFDAGWVAARPPERETGQRVAIVGSGPAGLAAAQQLRRKGHAVEVFERDDRIGGLLMYGVPNMKLDKALVERRIDQLKQEGVVFHTGATIDDGKLDLLAETHHAVLLATGSGVPRKLQVEGEELEGVHFAMEYLRESTAALLDGRAPELSAAGKHVVVIGGGDTGTDCIATALRQGCASLTNLELLPQPEASRTDANPWPTWPRVYRVDYGHAESHARFGVDPRRFGVMTTRLLSQHAMNGGSARNVGGVATAGVQVRDGRPQPVEGTEQVQQADLVLLALGYEGAELLGPLPGHHRSYHAGRNLFVAGDCRRGPSLVVWAIAEGREAAEAIDRSLTRMSQQGA